MTNSIHLFYQLATLTERRSKLLADESRLWADASRALFDAGSIASSSSEKSSRAPAKPDNRELPTMQPVVNDASSLTLLTVQDVIQWYGVSKTTVYKLLKTGQIRAIKLGRSTRIHRDAIDEWLRSLPSYESHS